MGTDPIFLRWSSRSGSGRPPTATASRLPGSKAEPNLLELAREARAHRFDLSPGGFGEVDIGHVVHAAGDEHLQAAFFGADIAKGAAHAGRERDGVEELEDCAFATVVVPAHLEAALEHGEGLVSLAVRVQPRALARRAHRERHRHARRAA